MFIFPPFLCNVLTLISVNLFKMPTKRPILPFWQPSARESAAVSSWSASWYRSARESVAQSARNAQWHRSARELGIFFGAGALVERFRAGISCPTRPECQSMKFCAGMGYLFRRGMEKCSRLRGMGAPNPPGMPRATVLRRNGVSFSARGC